MIFIVGVASLKRPGAALGLIFIMFGLEQFFQTQAAIFIDRSRIVNMGVGLVSAMAAIAWLSKNGYQYKLDKIQIVALLLILYSQLSQFWTISPQKFNQYYGRAPLPYYALYLFIAPILSQGKNAIRNGVWATIYVGIPLIFLITFYVEWSGRGVALAKAMIDQHGKRVPYAAPLSLADAASYIAVMCLILKPKNILWKILHIATFALASYIVFRTQSRGQLVALGLVALMFYPIANQATKSKELFLTLGGFTIVGLALYFAFTSLDLGGVNRWTNRSLEGSTLGRLRMVKSLLNEWYNSGPFYIIFGLGSAAGWKTSGFAVHNLSAEILGELGLIGFSLYLYICIQAFVSAAKVIKKLKHYPDMRREAVILISLFTYSCILSLKSIALYSSAPLMFYFAVAVSQLERHSRQFSSESMSWKKLLLTSNMAHDTAQNSQRYAPKHR